MKKHIAYKVEISPTQEQIIKINKTMGVCKFIYNLYITKNKEKYEEDKSFISAFSFSKWVNNEFIPNNPTYSWVKEVSSKAIKQSICNAETSFKKFFNRQTKFPRYKKKTDSVWIYLPKNNPTDCTIERHRVKIPTLGFVRLKEFGYIPLNSKVSSMTVTKQAHKYFVSVLCEVDDIAHVNNEYSEGIGVDLGIKDFAISSTNTTYKNINKTNKIKKLEKKLKREQRAFSRKLLKNKNKKGKDSNLKKNKLRVQKLHMQLSNTRKEYVRFVVNSLVKNSPQFVAIEDLNVKGMMKNRHLSKAISQSNFYYFRVFLIQQCKKKGIEVRIIDRFYPSSKLCNCCGSIKKDLKLSDRIYKCDCGYVEDRDLNASFNIRDCEKYKVAQ